MTSSRSVLHVTVTTVEGQPRMQLPGDMSMDQLKETVRNRFGFQVPNGVVALPHSFCANLVPPAERRHTDDSSDAAQPMFLTQRGHLRVI